MIDIDSDNAKLRYRYGRTDFGQRLLLARRLVGIDHVGLGPDVNGNDDDQWPEGMNHIGELPHLTAELLRRGYSEERLRKIYSDNLRRVYAQSLPVI